MRFDFAGARVNYVFISLGFGVKRQLIDSIAAAAGFPRRGEVRVGGFDTCIFQRDSFRLGFADVARCRGFRRSGCFVVVIIARGAVVRLICGIVRVGVARSIVRRARMAVLRGVGGRAACVRGFFIIGKCKGQNLAAVSVHFADEIAVFCGEIHAVNRLVVVVFQLGRHRGRDCLANPGGFQRDVLGAAHANHHFGRGGDCIRQVRGVVLRRHRVAGCHAG